ncbi:unnamed protein product, partial [Effrenium voratum]
PGLMVMESSPEAGMSHYEGISLPKPRRGVLQITGSEKLNYFMPSRALGTNYMDVASAVRAQLPVPQWLMSLELVKRFLADVFTATLKGVLEHVNKSWDTLPFQKEIDTDPRFFKDIQDIMDASSAESKEESNGGAQ